MQGVDDFIDDATTRRLGNGAKFYGKRRSNFYGEGDAQRKKNPRVADREEDYSGPSGGSFFLLSEERDEKGRPLGFLTRREARELARQRVRSAVRETADPPRAVGRAPGLRWARRGALAGRSGARVLAGAAQRLCAAGKEREDAHAHAHALVFVCARATRPPGLGCLSPLGHRREPQ